MQAQPYLFFEGRCEEALNFYREAIGAEVTALLRYSESPDPSTVEPGMAEKVMHANLTIGDTQVMASDGRMQETASFRGFALTLTVADLAEAERCFQALADGAEVGMPLSQTFWSPAFGMLTDRFGVMWMVMVPA